MKDRKYADLHLHVSLKHYVNKLGDIWYHKPFIPGHDRPKRSEAGKYTQSDVQSLIKGNVDIGVVGLYALEDILDFSFTSKLISKVFFGFDLQRVKQLRRRYNTKYGMLLHERDFIKKGPKRKYGKEYVLVKNRTDLDSDHTKLILAIEGGHCLHGTNAHGTPAFNQDVLRHLDEVKRWEHPVFMLTLCHFQYNYLAGQAWAVPLPGASKPLLKKVLPLLRATGNEGIGDLGWQVINKALDKTSGNRILIDLRHSSVQTRQQYYQYLKDQNLVGEVPVIASHMGVSGIDTFHNQLTQVDNEKANAAKHRTKFNPWAINLCDDDIREITTIGGMIGLSVDQRIVGSSNTSFKKRIKRTLRKARRSPNRANWHTMLFLENVFHIVATAGKPEAWDMICLSSDNDGIIDPIDSCPTAIQLRDFEKRLADIAFPYYQHCDYRGRVFINTASELQQRLRQVLYDNLKGFIKEHFPV